MRKTIAIIGLCITAALFLISDIYPQTSKPSSGGGDSQAFSRSTIINVAQKASPSVVNVFNMREESVFGTKVLQGRGTGFIIDSKQGIILTNNHVVRGAKGLAVTLNDKRNFKVKLIGKDPIIDVAVIKIENPPTDLKQVQLGNSDKVQPGEWVIAIGQPFGYQYTVTTGIVCGLGREVPIGREQIETIEYRGQYIQIDALINPGNSGGPLFNLNGEVIGINTVGFGGGGVGGGYGGSIPINAALEIKDKIINSKDGKVIRAYLGIRGTDIDDFLAYRFNTTVDDLVKDLGLKGPKGIFIQGAAEGSPAESVGFAESDVLIEFEGKKVDNLKDFRVIMEKLKPEQEVKLKYISKREEKTATVKLVEMGGDKKADDKEPAEGEDE